ncbi:MAG: CopG family transcriptional regulator [Acidobacteriota bacterium]
MRTTIKLDPDVGAAVERIRKSSSRGVSETVNDLIRRGLGARARARRFVQASAPVGLRVDVSNVAEVLELLEGPGSR